MAKEKTTTVRLTTNTGVMEISGLSLQEIKELAGLNGYASPVARAKGKSAGQKHSASEPDYVSFKLRLSSLAKKFLDVLRQHPTGLRAEALVEKMGVNSTTQLGGITGGGMARLAKKFGIDLDDVYERDTTFEGTERRTVYKPGKDIARLQ